MRIEVHRTTGHLMTVLTDWEYPIRVGEHIVHEGKPYVCMHVGWRRDESMGQVETISVDPLVPPSQARRSG